MKTQDHTPPVNHELRSFASRRALTAGSTAACLVLTACTPQQRPEQAQTTSPSCASQQVGRVALSRDRWEALRADAAPTASEIASLTARGTVQPHVIMAQRRQAAELGDSAATTIVPTIADMTAVSTQMGRAVPSITLAGWSSVEHPAIPDGTMEVVTTRLVCTGGALPTSIPSR